MRIPLTRDEIEQRHREFHDGYGSRHDFEGNDLIACVIACGEFLTCILGAEPVASAMARLSEELGYGQPDTEAEWMEHLREHAGMDAFCWHLGEVFHALNAYGYYGIYVCPDDPDRSREDSIAALIKEVAEFLALVPSVWDVAIGDTRRTLTQAQARWALDHGEALTPEELAAVAGVSPRTISNLASAGGLRRVAGKIPAEDALAWLEERDDFRASVWQYQQAAVEIEAVEQTLAEVVFVPIAKDGSVFHPGCVSDGFYAVGDPEQRVADFREALDLLQRMPTPKWRRRKHADGNWGRVAGVRWERKTMQEVEELSGV